MGRNPPWRHKLKTSAASSHGDPPGHPRGRQGREVLQGVQRLRDRVGHQERRLHMQTVRRGVGQVVAGVRGRPSTSEFGVHAPRLLHHGSPLVPRIRRPRVRRLHSVEGQDGAQRSRGRHRRRRRAPHPTQDEEDAPLQERGAHHARDRVPRHSVSAPHARRNGEHDQHVRHESADIHETERQGRTQELPHVPVRSAQAVRAGGERRVPALPDHHQDAQDAVEERATVEAHRDRR